MRIYISAISAVVVGLLLSVSGGTATPNDDDESTDYFQQQYDQSDIEQTQQQHHPMLRHEPPAWAAATYSNDDVGRRLQDVCVPGTNPYSSTTIASGIGTGSPDAPGSCTSSGGSPCNSQNNGGDRCVFPQCNGDGIAEDVWDKKFDNWSGTTTADSIYTENIDDGTYTYFFTVTSSNVGSSISYGKCKDGGTSKCVSVERWYRLFRSLLPPLSSHNLSYFHPMLPSPPQPL